MPFASAKQKRYLRWKRPDVYEQIASHDSRVAKSDDEVLADFFGVHDIYGSWVSKEDGSEDGRSTARTVGAVAGATAAAAGTGAVVHRAIGQQDAGVPLSRRGRRVRRKLARKEGKVVNLSPGQFRAVAEGQGWSGRSKSAAVARGMRWRKGGDRKGPTKVTVYSNRVVQHGGSNKAQARAMRGRRIPVRVVGVKEGMPSTLPRFAARAADRRTQAYRRDLKETTRSTPGRIKREASAYRAGRTTVRAVLRKADDKSDSRRKQIAAGATAAAAGTAAATIPVKRTKPGADAKKVRAKLTSPLRPGGRAKLTAREFASVNGGRGYRFSNDKYTARLAGAMGRGKVKQNRLVMDIYDDAIMQRDGAHRAHASAMLGRKIKVKAVRHRGPAPKHSSLAGRVGYDVARKRHAKRLKEPPRTVRQLERYGGRVGPVSRALTEAQARASQTAYKSPTVSPKNAGAVAAPLVLAAAAGGAAVHRHRKADKVEKQSKHQLRAKRVAEGSLPTGSAVGGLKVKGHVVGDANYYPNVETQFSDSSGRKVGQAKTMSMPGKRYMVSSMELDPSARGTGAGRQAQKQFIDNAAKSKDVRRAYMLAAGGGSRSSNQMSGARAWRADKRMRYVPGAGILTNVDRTQVASLDRKQRRRARVYVARTRVGLARPHALHGDKVPRGLDAETADALRNTSWGGSVKGRAPSHGKRLAVAGAAAYGVSRGAKALRARGAEQRAKAVRRRNTRIAIGAGGTAAALGTGAAVAGSRRERS